jgi:hypothetical protein
MEQAAQLPLHAPSQHTPSTQKPVSQLAPVLQDAPSGRAATHAPPLHAYPWMQDAELAQEVGQVAPPPHVNRPQLPPVPAGKVVHVPSAVAPRAWRQTLHPPAQAPLQHTPSAQLPELHCAPFVQGDPNASAVVHAPPVHGTPGAHCAEEAQEVGQVDAPPHT